MRRRFTVIAEDVSQRPALNSIAKPSEILPQIISAVSRGWLVEVIISTANESDGHAMSQQGEGSGAAGPPAVTDAVVRDGLLAARKFVGHDTDCRQGLYGRDVAPECSCSGERAAFWRAVNAVLAPRPAGGS